MVEGFSNTDWELVIEPVRGERGFGIDSDSKKLTGLTHSDYEFEDGLNQAWCGPRKMRSRSLNSTMQRLLALSYGLETSASVVPHNAFTDKAHRMQDHHCGFWAYFANADDKYTVGSQVNGIIEGQGKTVIGEKGFRAEKAKVVALYPLKAAKNEWWRRAYRMLFPSREWFSEHSRLWSFLDNLNVIAFTAVGLGFTVGLNFLAIMLFRQVLDLGFLGTLVGWLVSFWAVSFLTRAVLTSPDTGNNGMRSRGTWGRVSPFSDAFLEQTAAQYPSARLFDSRREALEAFPLTPPPPPAPKKSIDEIIDLLHSGAISTSAAMQKLQGYVTDATVSTKKFVDVLDQVQQHQLQQLQRRYSHTVARPDKTPKPGDPPPTQ